MLKVIYPGASIVAIKTCLQRETFCRSPNEEELTGAWSQVPGFLALMEKCPQMDKCRCTGVPAVKGVGIGERLVSAI